MLLELSADVRTFFTILTSVVGYYVPQLQQWEREGLNVEEAIHLYNRKIINAINKFSKNIVNSLETVVEILVILQEQAGAIKDIFYCSELSKNIEGLFDQLSIYSPDNLPLFRKLYIEMRAYLTFLTNVKMQ
jgi:hypothetical protein